MTPRSLNPKKDFYEILGLDRDTATDASIKSAYRKLALKHHPDKQSATATDEEKQEATEAFQQIGLAYTVLSDSSKKSYYDRTGNVGEGFLDGEKDWTAYFKELWTGVVNAETIETQASKYKDSEEERRDVLKYYKRCKGNMNKILNYVECSTEEDGPRLTKIIRKAIDEKEVETYINFAKTTTSAAHKERIKQAKKNAEAFDRQHKTEKKDESLKALIMARHTDRKQRMDDVIESLAEKAGKKRKRAVAEDEPSEEEFQKIQERLLKRKKA
ncbi:hypothetical protein DFQ28_002598 [Apophysomyces sp. BC1034]|nr:hypothetical protein DFQ30_002991 [Apophysomyces sp. BC1015]KAG0179609.1 hypothetical protein DFQ29_001866 [Apophysomyces sp. BC1021]KAG0190023.1 hypothetical protein DFQ28_002598 [Apophysomyces sp. BC1034]